MLMHPVNECIFYANTKTNREDAASSSAGVGSQLSINVCNWLAAKWFRSTARVPVGVATAYYIYIAPTSASNQWLIIISNCPARKGTDTFFFLSNRANSRYWNDCRNDVVSRSFIRATHFEPLFVHWNWDENCSAAILTILTLMSKE